MDMKIIAVCIAVLFVVLFAVQGYAKAESVTTSTDSAPVQEKSSTCSACCGDNCGSCCGGGSCSKVGTGASSCGC